MGKRKKIVALAAACATALAAGFCIGIRSGANAESFAFDETKIVASTALMADIHIGYGSDAGDKFNAALTYLKQLRPDLDALLFVGDLTDTTYATKQPTQILEFKRILEQNYNPVTTPVFYSLGNHDTFYDTNTLTQLFIDTFGEQYFAYDDVSDEDSVQMRSIGCRKMEVNGQIVLSIPYDDGYVLDTRAGEWLDDQLAAITAEKPDRYVIVLSHAPAPDTVWRSSSAKANAIDGLDVILKKYPQALCFTGHIHMDLNNSRSVMQTDYTTALVGSTNYMSESVTFPEENFVGDVLGRGNIREYSQFTICETDENGNVRLTRVDSHNRRIINTLYLDAPKTDKSHLDRYSVARADRVVKPYFETGKVPTVEQRSAVSAVVTLPQAKGDDLWNYELSVSDASGTELYSATYTPNIYLYTYANLPEFLECRIDGVQFIAGDRYTVSVRARDVWGNFSESLNAVFVGSEEFRAYEYYVPLGESREEGIFVSENKVAAISGQDYQNWTFPEKTPNGGGYTVADPYVTYSVKDLCIPTGTNGFIAIRAKTNIGHLLGNIRVNSTEISSYALIHYLFQDTTDWQTVVLSLSELSNVTEKHHEGYYSEIRLDIGKNTSTSELAIQENSYFYLESLAFFSVREDAEAYAGIGSAPAAPQVSEVTYTEQLVEGETPHADAFSATTSVPGYFSASPIQTIATQKSLFRWKFTPEDTENYRIVYGIMEIEVSRNPKDRYVWLTDMTDPENETFYNNKTNVNLRTEDGVTKAEFPSMSVSDPYFSVDLSRFDAKLTDYPVVAFRVRTNITGLHAEIRFVTDNVSEWWAWSAKTVAEDGEWQMIAFDLRQTEGFASRDYVNGKLRSIRFDWYNAAGDLLELKEGDYFEFDSTGIFRDMVSAMSYQGISSMTPVISAPHYTGSLVPGAALDASELMAETSVSGSFSFEESEIAEGEHIYHWTFTPDDVNLFAVKGTIELAGFNKATPEVGTPVYSGSLLEGDEPDGTKLTGDTSVPGRFIFEETALIVGTHLYHWTFIPEDGETYLEVTGTIELTVKLRPSVSGVSYAGNAVAGEAPDASKLLAATDIEGTFRIVETAFVEGSATYHWIFTPADENYGEVTGTLEITAQAAEEEPEKTGCGCGGIGLGWAGFGGLGGVLILASVLFRRKKEVME